MKDQLLNNPNLNATLPPVTPTDVSVIRTKNYLMPGTCVVCNAPKSLGHKVQAGHSIKYGRTEVTLSLDFPVCPDCGAVQDEFTHNARIGAAIGGGLAVLGGIIYYIVLSTSTGTKFSENCGAFFCYPIIGFFVLWFAAYQLLNLMMPQLVRERKKRIDQAVKIVFFDSMYVNYRFQNAIYAELFKSLNTLPTGDDLNKLVNQMTTPPPLPGAAAEANPVSKPAAKPTSLATMAATAASKASEPVTMPPSRPSTEVLLKRTDNYKMPGTCVVCNATAEPQKTLVASVQIQREGVNQGAKVAFPLCKDCNQAQQEIRKNHIIAAIIAGAIVAPFLVILIINASNSSSNRSIFGECLGLAAWFGIIYWIATALLKKRLSPPIRERLQKRKNAASITYFDSVFIRFYIPNTEFAAKFRGLNEVYSPPSVVDYLRTKQ